MSASTARRCLSQGLPSPGLASGRGEERRESGLFRGVRVEFAALRSGSFEHIRARASRRRGRDDPQAGDACDRALLPEPLHGRDVVARVPDHLPAAERAARRQRGARVSARRRRAGARGARAAAHLRIGAAGRRLPDRRVLARLRAGAGRPGRLPRPGRDPRVRRGAGGATRQHPAGRHRRPAHLLEPDPGRALRRRDAARRERGDAARADRRAARRARPRGAARRPGRAARLLRAVDPRRAPARRRRRERREPARLLADPDAEHRARATCS